MLISCSKDCTIKFFDLTQTNQKRAFRFIQVKRETKKKKNSCSTTQMSNLSKIRPLFFFCFFKDTHNIRSLQIHPCGEYLIAGTQNNTIRIYDIASMKCYVSPRLSDNHTAPVNQVRYGPDGNIYASCAKDGTIKIWDGVSNKIITTWLKPHLGHEVSERVAELANVIFVKRKTQNKGDECCLEQKPKVFVDMRQRCGCQTLGCVNWKGVYDISTFCNFLGTVFFFRFFCLMVWTLTFIFFFFCLMVWTLHL